MKRNQGLNPQEILKILKWLNNTFKIIVNSLIVHRDLKLGSIFIKYKNIENTEYDFKLGDYDVSTRLNSLNQKMDLMVDTLNYFPPEILKGEVDYDAKCDLWNLRVVIYTLLFNEFPFIVKHGKYDGFE